MAVPNVLEVLRFVSDTMDQLAGQARLAQITVPAPFAPPTSFLRTQPPNMWFFWESPGGTCFAGGGAAKTIRVSGEERFSQLREQVDALWSELGVYVHPDSQPPPPRVFGGMAFHPGATEWPWDQFGDGCFTLPRWCYARRSARAFLSLALRGDVDCTGPRKRELLKELESILHVLSNAEEHSALLEHPHIAQARAATLQQVDLSRWVEHIDKIRGAIATGAFQKIVAARRCDVALPPDIDQLDVLARLVIQPMCTRFLFGRENISFLGASPEVLFDKRGNIVRTEALAGTACCPPGAEPDAYAKELLDSEKDLSEHAFVVHEISRTLAPLCEELRASKKPKVHRIREILHLHTPFKGRLKRDVHPVSILEAMHPTPAVGGLPTADAARWIANNESGSRGWYTGPVGWLDATGDARFVVAIRCGLVGNSRAHIFTGAGIVTESHAHAEYAETSLKQLPLLRALGIFDARPEDENVPDLPAPSSHRARALLEILQVAENA